MPDDYYVSQYSGEEIDALLSGAGTGTVRYDAAQTLTDAQKQQARGNIGAAPAGFGLGEGAKFLTSADDLNDIWQSGNYAWGNASVPKNVPNTALIVDVFIMHVWGYNSQAMYQEIVPITNGQTNNSANNNKLVRSRYGTVIRAWEWVNPPMQLGVEYRTTERYLGKPVYIRLEEIAALPNNDTLTVSNVGVPSGGTLYVDNIVDYRAEFYFDSAVFSIPYNDVVDITECNGSRYGGGITYSIRTKGVDYSNYAGRIWIKYTKQTD